MNSLLMLSHSIKWNGNRLLMNEECVVVCCCSMQKKIYQAQRRLADENCSKETFTLYSMSVCHYEYEVDVEI